MSLSCDDGGSVAYFVSGSGEPVVFIHGLGLDSSMWKPQLGALSRICRVIRYDVRGFGDSSVPTGAYSRSADLYSLLDHLGACPAHVVGLSMGGNIALRFAVDQPLAVKSLVLLDPALEGHAWSSVWAQKMNAIRAAARVGDVEAAKRLWLMHDLFAPARRNADVSASLSGMIERYSGWHWSHVDPAVAPPPPISERLADIACPTLIVLGALDAPDFHAIAQRLSNEIPGATLVTIPDVGHMSSMEAPDVVNGLIMNHLRDLGVTGA